MDDTLAIEYSNSTESEKSKLLERLDSKRLKKGIQEKLKQSKDPASAHRVCQTLIHKMWTPDGKVFDMNVKQGNICSMTDCGFVQYLLKSRTGMPYTGSHTRRGP